MSRFGGWSIATRIALAAMAVAVVAIAIVAIGISIVGGRLFMDLMTSLGETSRDAEAMFDSTVLAVLAVAAGASVLAAAALAIIVGSRIARPLRDLSRAARRVAAGDLGARVERHGPEELVSLADSFNAMSRALADQERQRQELIENAAHELRTPLTNLKGYLEGLRDSVIAPNRATFESLLEEAERLVRLSASLDELADAVVHAAPHVLRTDIGHVARATVELARPSAEARRLAFEVDMPGTLHAMADSDEVAQVVANLLQNAVRYATEGGVISVAAARQGDVVTVSVTNPGPSIPSHHLPHLFERFYRVDPSRDRRSGGAGIGLAIARELVERAGGSIGVASEGAVTRFWFSLPAA